MKKVFYIVFLLALHLKVLHAEIAVDWDIKRLEDKFRSEAELGLKEYLGPTKKFKVYIQVIGKKNTEEKKALIMEIANLVIFQLPTAIKI